MISSDLPQFDKATAERVSQYDKLLSYRPNNSKMLRMHKSDAKTRMLFGGRRSGKTTWEVVEACWAALGIHPYLEYPPPPLKIRICSVDFVSGVKGIILPEIRRWLPKQAEKHYWSDDRILELNNGTSIDFKSYDQDLEKFEGVERHLVIMDEEPPKDIYQSNYMRTISSGINGKLIIACTPLHGMCFDSETQILSKNGWSYWNELSLGDEILTFNKDEEVLEWKPIDTLYCNFGYSSDMVHMSCKGFDALVTPNHRWPVFDKYDIKVVETKDLKTHHSIFRVSDYHEFPRERLYNDSFVRLVGWVITDGSLRPKHREIKVYQSESRYPENCDNIRKVFTKVFGENGFTEHRYKYSDKLVNGAYKSYPDGYQIHFIALGEKAELIRKLFPNRELTPGFILSLPRDQLVILYETLLDGDGSRNSNGDKFKQKYNKNLEMFQMICVLLGYKSTQYKSDNDGRYYDVHVSKKDKPLTRVAGLDRIVEQYSGIVWCPHTKNDTVVARRNGTVYISSNTWVYSDLYDNAEAVYPYVEYVHVRTDENPHIDKVAIEGIKKDPAMKDCLDAALYGEFISRSGLVYREFDDHNIIDPLPVEKLKELMIVISIDPHDRNPHGVLFAGLDSDNNWYVFDEILHACVITDLAAMIHKKLGTLGPPRICVMDTHGNIVQSTSGISVKTELARKGIYALDAHKDFQAGRFKVAGLIAHDEVNGKLTKAPKLYVTRNCVNVIREFRHYVWDEWIRKRNKYDPKERPLKRDDHLMDALRYCVMLDVVYRPPGFKFRANPEVRDTNRVTGYYLGK